MPGMSLRPPEGCVAVPLTEGGKLDSQSVEDSFEVAQDEVVAGVAQSVPIHLADSQPSDRLRHVVGQRLVQPMQRAQQPVDAELRVVLDVLPVTLQ